MAYRFPILIWEDVGGGFTAATVDDAVSASAAADSARDAARQVEDYLRWLYDRAPWRRGPDFLEPRLVQVKVEVRPEYRVEADDAPDQVAAGAAAAARMYACQETVALRVACVCGHDSAGLRLCVMPILGLGFTYYDEPSLRELVTHGVQSALRGMTPRDVARLLPPRAVVLDQVIVHVPRAARGSRAREDLEPEQLPAVAEPLGPRGVRHQLARPWERDEQVARLVEALGRERASVILVGEPGTGKTAVLAEAARKVERGPAAGTPAGSNPRPGDGGDDEPDGGTSPRHRYRFWMTGAARLIAGMRYLGQWQERCEAVVAELAGMGGTLCVENLLELVRAGGVGPADGLAAFLMPYLQRGELRVVGECTPAELDACRRLLPGFADLFQVHMIPPFTRRQAVAALGQLAAAQGRHLNVGVERGTVELLCRLFGRFMPYHSLPGRASAFLAQLLDRAHRAREPTVSHRHVIAQLVGQTGLPEWLLRDETPLDRREVLDELRRRVIGQDPACEAAADLVVTLKAGLNDPNRPIGVLLLAGPTGVGKTELAKALSGYVFGHGEQKDRLVRLDMSEYAGPSAVPRLLGDARGEPSPFVRRVRQQPFSVVLLDEIEKAAPEVFDVLLGVLDEGRLTDPYGRLTSFRSTILVMTTNLGAHRPSGFGLARDADARPRYDDEAMRFFRPEFYNRIDAVVSFEPLGRDAMRRITEKELADLARREGLARMNLRLAWTEQMVDLLVERGFDRRYGARPLQRTLEALVGVPLAKFLLDHPQVTGRLILLDIDPDGSLVIRLAAES